MERFRKLARIVGTILLANFPWPAILGLLVVKRSPRALDPDDIGSADPTKPDAFHHWPSFTIPVLRQNDIKQSQTTELVVDEKKAGIEFIPENGEGPGVRLRKRVD